MNELKQPLVSIVVVTYNSSRFVFETLESVKKQTWQNIELIVTDDCSTDNTLDICGEWVEKNKERFIRTEILTVNSNTGIPSNNNRAIKNSCGEWIKLIAGDDILLTTCIEDNVEYVIKNPDARFVVSELVEINDNGIFINNEKENEQKGKMLKYFFNTKTAQEQLKAYARWPVFLNAPSFFISKKLLKEIDYFDDEYKIFDDMPLIYRVNSYGTIIQFMNKITVKYRIHDKSISRNQANSDERDKEVLTIFMKYRRRNLKKTNLIDLSVFYERWINYCWKGIRGHKGHLVLNKLSFFYWYLKLYNYN
jgi:alpha-1,3-rhamnosyltransferase